jgi:hypothetical protein
MKIFFPKKLKKDLYWNFFIRQVAKRTVFFSRRIVTVASLHAKLVKGNDFSKNPRCNFFTCQVFGKVECGAVCTLKLLSSWVWRALQLAINCPVVSFQISLPLVGLSLPTHLFSCTSMVAKFSAGEERDSFVSKFKMK